MPDPTMPRVMPPEIERALLEMQGWRTAPAPVDLYMAVRDTLLEVEAERIAGQAARE